jgi:ribosomal subunit interface protein
MAINYNIKGTGVDISDELRSHVERKLEHTAKFLGGDTTTHADVELAYDRVRDGVGKYRAEFTVSASGAIYRAEVWGSTLHEAIDVAVGELLEELSRNKKKRLDIFRHSAVKVKEYLRGWRRKM